MKSNRLKTTTRRRAFTLLELLIAVIIIGILAVLILFAYVRKADDARIVKAMLDLEHLAQAETQFCVDTDYFCGLYFLDDDLTTYTNTAGLSDNTFIRHHGDVNTAGEIETDNNEVWRRIRPIVSNPNRHRGPYSEFKERVYEWYTGDYPVLNQPIDPWGNLYMLFTPKGYVNFPPSANVTQYPVFGYEFDRYTVMSAGPDGLVGTSDDLKRQF